MVLVCGVCPESICSGMAGTYETDGLVVKGWMIALSDTEINFSTFPDTGAYRAIGICLAATDV